MAVHRLLAGLGIAFFGVASRLASVRAASPLHLPSTVRQTNSTRTLNLQDSTWARVRVEVRVGPGTSCDALGSLGVQVLQVGQEWTVNFDDAVICWRREQSPGTAASTWAPWNQLQLADGEVRAVTL